MSSKNSLQGGDKNQNIKVYVRCRPINEQERKARSTMSVDVNEHRRTVIVKSHHEKTFTFDGTFGKDSTQIDLYRTVVQPLISEVLQGYNCTVFAYGQTGTGKTYTMEGIRSQALLSWQHDPHAGVVPRALHQIFSEAGDPELNIIKVSFLELYNEELFDLLGSGEALNLKMKIFEDATAKGSVVVRGLEEVVVRDRQEVYALLERGASRRQVAATMMNATSSRSHTIFTITVISKDITDAGEGLMRTGKLNLVDLAGSENIGRSGAQDKRAREAGNINQSLLTLGRVITALVERTPHIPYRESKLTRLLQDSLGGRTKTSIVATISPAHINLEETLSTLEYAFRAKNIMNRPEVNQKLCKEVVLKHMTDELEQLRRDLIACREKNGFYIDETNYRSMQSRLDLQSEELQKKAEEMTEMAERVDLLKTQIDQVNELFAKTQKQLEIESHCKEVAQTRLKEVNWNYTTAKVLIKAHRQTEDKLHEDATTLINTAEIAKTDVQKLHEKVQRQLEVELHNTQVVEEITAILSSSLDSVSRKMGDAFETLAKSSSLNDEAVKSFQQRGELLKQSGCLLGSLIENHVGHQRKFFEDINTINQKASDSVKTLKQTFASLDENMQSTFTSATEMLFGNLTAQLNSVKNSLKSNFNQISELVANSREATLEPQANLQQSSEQLQRISENMAESVTQELATSKAQSEELEKLWQQMKSCIDGVFESRNSFANRAGQTAGVLAQQSESVHRANRHLSEISSRLANEVILQVGRTNEIIAQNEAEQQNSLKLFGDSLKTDLDDMKENLGENVETTTQALNEVIKTAGTASMEFANASNSSRTLMTSLASSLQSTERSMTQARNKVSILKEKTTNILARDVKRCPVTGSTPVKRSYEIPRSLARTQPLDLIQQKMLKKLEEAPIEQRNALDEGHSILLDVTATPEMLEFE